jgi:hypothetical protein
VEQLAGVFFTPRFDGFLGLGEEGAVGGTHEGYAVPLL